MGWYGQGQAPAPQMSPDNAKQTALRYADRYLKGFSVDKVLPFTGMGGVTMCSVELKGPDNGLRTVHVNQWGQVMPFGGTAAKLSCLRQASGAPDAGSWIPPDSCIIKD